ncbi:MAG: hypothetical protein ABIZ91_17695 [Gemmatimonadaceae bacterium]
MRRLHIYVVALALATVPTVPHAQDTSPCSVAIPSSGDGMAYYDHLERLFVRLDSAFLAQLQSGEATLDDATRTRFDEARMHVVEAFDRITNSRAQRFSALALFDELGAYPDFVGAGYGGGTPPAALQEMLCPISIAYLRLLREEVDEHGRRLSIRYGEDSERLNIVEMLLNEWTASRAPMGKLRDPSSWEWILRMQTLGYQYRRDTRALQPSFPVFQLGTTYYFYGKGRFARTVHHLGLAAAYERDVTNQRHLVGAMLHIQQFDIGVLCASGCRDHVVVASRNFSLVGDAWANLRKGMGR